MSREPNGEFFVGYLPQQPPRTAGRVRGTVIAAAAAALALGALLVAEQEPYPDAHFEFTQIRDFLGTVQERPVPTLWSARPGDAGRSPSGHLLVAPGKHGAGMLVRGFEGRDVTLRGKLIWRSGLKMIEVVPGTLAAADSGPGVPPEERLGRVRLAGEIVDGKCYLGVMNPGEGKVHRDCAARCISGGAPPILAVAVEGQPARLVMLAGSQGEALAEPLLDFVAEPVTIEGDLVRHGDQYRLDADLATLRRDR